MTTELSKRDLRDMATQYKKGATLNQLSSSKKIGVGRVRDLLVEAGVEIRRPGATPSMDDNERLAKMKKMYADDHTLQQVGDEFGLSRERVRQILSGAGVETRDAGPRPQTELTKTEKKIAKLYDKGEKSPSDLMMEYDITYYSLRRILKRAGVDLKPKGYFVRGPEYDKADEVVRDYKAKMKIKDIAKKYGFPAPTKVYQILRRKGIEPNRHGTD